MSDAMLLELARRVSELERRLAALEGGGAAPAGPPPVDPEIRELLRSGNKINAVKRYRELTGAGLKEALDAVERLESGI
jgi:large subunit ribosomal protein L7/L12